MGSFAPETKQDYILRFDSKGSGKTQALRHKARAYYRYRIPACTGAHKEKCSTGKKRFETEAGRT